LTVEELDASILEAMEGPSSSSADTGMLGQLLERAKGRLKLPTEETE